MLKFDSGLITQVASGLGAIRPANLGAFEPLSLQRLDAPVLDAVLRLVTLLDEPSLIQQLAPLLEREIIIRLLNGPYARHLWSLVKTSSPTQQIGRVVTWIRQHLADEMRVEKLAEHANMSLTTSRQHFRMILNGSHLCPAELHVTHSKDERGS